MMKRIKHIFVILILFAGFSCRKDTPVPIDVQSNQSIPPPSETIYNYLYNYNAVFVNDYMPEPKVVNSACPEITSVNGYAYVIPGDANQLGIKYTNIDHEVTELYYGVKGVYGYYKVDVPPAKHKGAQTPSDSIGLVVIISQAITQSNFNIEINMADSSGNISEPFYLPVDLIAAKPGKLQISLSFDQANDLDLHLREPGGFEIFYKHPVSPNGGYLVNDANAGCIPDSANIEEILYPDSVPLGTYRVSVKYYMQCIPSVNTNFSVTAFYNGQLISPSCGTNPCNGKFYDDDAGTIADCMEFNIGCRIKLAHLRYTKGINIPNRPARIKENNK
jgi:hypothetical protein